MQSLTSDVSQLSISEPSTTSAPAQIPKEYDLSDSEHEALDGNVLRTFKLTVKYNEEPDWADLLRHIVNDDARLKTMSIEEAEELLTPDESPLKKILKDG